jgi:hypothetical protein
MGRREHYLWVGLGTTVDRELLQAAPDNAAALLVFVDGQAMLLPLSAWVEPLDNPPYRTSVPLHASLTARASLDQIQRIAKAALVEVRIVATDGTSMGYQMWQGDWPSWSLFAHAL